MRQPTQYEKEQRLKEWTSTAHADVIHINRHFIQNKVDLQIALGKVLEVEHFPIHVGRYGLNPWYELAPYRGMKLDDLTFRPPVLQTTESGLGKIEPIVHRTPLIMELRVSKFLDLGEMLHILPREIYYRWERENKIWIINYLLRNHISEKEKNVLRFWWSEDFGRVVENTPWGQGERIHPASRACLEEMVKCNLVYKFSGFTEAYQLNGDGITAMEILKGEVKVLE